MKQELEPGMTIRVIREGSPHPTVLKVQIVTGNGMVFLSPGKSRTATILVRKEDVIGGKIVDGGRLGKFRFFPQVQQAA